MFRHFSSRRMQSNPFKPTPTALAACWLAATWAVPVAAQVGGAPPLPSVSVQAAPDYLPDAGVATKTDTPAREVPFATSTVGRALLQDRGVTSMADALRTVPGVSAVTGIGGFNARVRFRGFLATSQLKNGFRQQVNFAVTEFQNVETLEVLRGQASSLYGRFEPGGVLNIVTKRPGVNVREVGVSLGSDGQRRATADLGGSTEGFAWRLNGAFENSDTFRDFVGNKTQFVAPSFSFKFSPDTTLDVDAEYTRREGAFDRGLPWAAGLSAAATQALNNLPASRYLGEPGDTFGNTTTWLATTLKHRLAGGTQLRAGVAQGRAQSDGNYFFPVGSTPLISATGVLSRRNQLTSDLNTDRTLYAEAQGKLMLGGVQNTWLAGIERNSSLDESRINRSTVNSLININAPVYNALRSPTTAVISNTQATNESTAIYMQNEARLSEQWRLTLGARSERVSSVFTDRATNTRRDSTADAITWRMGLAWLPTPDVVLFGNWGQSFNPSVTARGLVGGGQAVPERGEQTELGARLDLLDKRLSATLTVFDIRRSNVRVADTVNAALDRQVGEQRSRGVELELSGRPTPAWQIVASATSLNARITADTVAANVGKRLNQTPQSQLALWNRYDFSPAFGLGAGVVQVGDRYVDVANTFAIPAYTRWDLAAYGQISREVRWQLNLLNATNARFFESGNTTGNFYPGLPRTLRLALTARF